MIVIMMMIILIIVVIVVVIDVFEAPGHTWFRRQAGADQVLTVEAPLAAREVSKSCSSPLSHGLQIIYRQYYGYWGAFRMDIKLYVGMSF